MNQMPSLSRRAFVIGTAAVGSGLALGLDIPLGGPAVVRAADGAPEVNAWVVIRPDDTVVIRIARSEMGQGTLTGLAQLVAEELECDWSKVTTEFRPRARTWRASGVWGEYSTGGSPWYSHLARIRPQGRRPPARMMRIQAAANEWKVPRTECTAANSVITHAASGPHHHLRQGRRIRGQACAACRRQAQGPEGLEDRRQGPQAARHRRQDHRQDDL